MNERPWTDLDGASELAFAPVGPHNSSMRRSRQQLNVAIEQLNGLKETKVVQFAGVKTSIIYPETDGVTGVLFKAIGGAEGTVMTIDTVNYHVGIGDTSPENRLTISGEGGLKVSDAGYAITAVGDAQVDGFIDATGNIRTDAVFSSGTKRFLTSTAGIYSVYWGWNGSAYGGYLGGSGSVAQVGGGTGNDLSLRANGAEKVLIESDGTVTTTLPLNAGTKFQFTVAGAFLWGDTLASGTLGAAAGEVKIGGQVNVALSLLAHEQEGIRLDTDGTTTLRVKPRTASGTSGALTPASDDIDQFNAQGLTGAVTFGVPSGTPNDGQLLTIRIEDDGTNRALTWNGIYRVIGTTLPGTTAAGKIIYVKLVYNNTDTKWDAVLVTEEA